MIDLLCLYPENPESSRLKVICKRGEYSASRIAHAVEDCDAHVLNLNVTAEKMPDACGDDSIVVDLRVEHRNAASIMRSLERYGYVVIPVDVADDLNESNEEVELSALERFLQI